MNRPAVLLLLLLVSCKEKHPYYWVETSRYKPFNVEFEMDVKKSGDTEYLSYTYSPGRVERFRFNIKDFRSVSY